MTQKIMRRLRLLGPVGVDQVSENDSDAHETLASGVPRFRSRRTVALLGYLAAERRPVARDFLAALFWPDALPAKGRANLSRELHNLAQILPDCWELNRQAVAFAPSASTIVDVDRLVQLEMQERWEETAVLLGGEFLEGLVLDDNLEFENWLLNERERWRSRAEIILKQVIEGLTRRGRYPAALRYARHLLRFAPWDEETHRQMMRFLAWTGQRGAALHQFELCQQVLWEELAVEPATETVTLYQQIKQGQLDLPPQLPAFLTDESAEHRFKRPFFVGRERELAQLDSFLETALAGEGRVVFVTGGPGRGKTALLTTFAQQAMAKHPSLLVASGKCNAYAGMGDPYLPYREALAMLTGDIEGRWQAGTISRDHAQRLWDASALVIPALLNQDPDLLEVFVSGTALLSRSVAVGQTVAPWLPRLREQVERRRVTTKDLEQSYLFQQVTNVLYAVAQKRPLLLFLDDLQWADTASIALLFHLSRQLADVGSRLLIVCAYRPEEVALNRSGERHPLAKVLNECKRVFGDVWIELGQAEKEEERKFTDALLDGEHNRLGERFRDRLFERTKGHPLFTLELLGNMQARGELIRDADQAWIEGPTLAWEGLPARVEAVIAERMDRLDPELREVLAIASVEGELFTAQVLADVAHLDERALLHRLSQDIEKQHRLVREQEVVYTGQGWISRYQFGHALFQEYLYQSLSQRERQLLHGDVAVALEKLYAGQLDEIAVTLAHHFYQADNYQQAFHYSALAADRAARLYESREAITHYTRAIQLSEKVSPDVVSLVALHRGRGIASERLGDFNQADSDHTTILGLAQAAGNHQIAWQALIDLGRLWASRNYNQTREYFEAALELARGVNDQALLAGSLNWMGNWYANDENSQQAIACHEEALAIFDHFGDQQELANTLDLLGIANMLGGDLNQCLRHYDQAVALFRALDNRPRLASSLVGRATIGSVLVYGVSVPAMPAPNVSSDFDEALQVARETGSVSEETWAHWTYGLWHIVNGRFGAALQIMQRGLQIAAAVGHGEWVVATRFALGMLHVALFAYEEAKEQLESVLALAKDLNSPQWIYLVSGTLTEAYLGLNDLDSAGCCLAMVVSEQTPMDTLSRRYCWMRRAELALAQGEAAIALDIMERLIASARGLLPGRVITLLWQLKAEALAASGCPEDALPLLPVAIANAQATGERFLLWRLYASMGRLYSILGQWEAAENALATAETLITELAAIIPDETLKECFQQRAYSSLSF